ncbi:MAG: hypothetical protein Q8S41_09215 [Lutibacter sp.]|nr:hypothetical protein [Lutibacter sp.]
MTANTLKKKIDGYLPLLTIKQQTLLLEIIKNLLNVDIEAKRISRKQYNIEIKEAVTSIEKGDFIKHEDALKELSKW